MLVETCTALPWLAPQAPTPWLLGTLPCGDRARLRKGVVPERWGDHTGQGAQGHIGGALDALGGIMTDEGSRQRGKGQVEKGASLQQMGALLKVRDDLVLGMHGEDLDWSQMPTGKLGST